MSNKVDIAILRANPWREEFPQYEFFPVCLTPDLWRSLCLQGCEYKLNRGEGKPKEQLVGPYSRRMTGRTWVPAAVNFVLGRFPDGRLQIANGHQTGISVERSGVPCNIIAKVVDVADDEAFKRLYCSFDNKARSAREIASSIVAAKELGIEPTQYTTLQTAANCFVRGFASHGAANVLDQVDGLAVTGEMREYLAEAKTYFRYATPASRVYKQLMKRGTIAALALHLIRHFPTSAKRFLNSAAIGSTTTDTGGDPCLELHEYLFKTAGERSAKKDFAAVVLAWNAYKAGETVRLAKGALKKAMREKRDFLDVPARAGAIGVKVKQAA